MTPLGADSWEGWKTRLTLQPEYLPVYDAQKTSSSIGGCRRRCRSTAGLLYPPGGTAFLFACGLFHPSCVLEVRGTRLPARFPASPAKIRRSRLQMYAKRGLCFQIEALPVRGSCGAAAVPHRYTFPAADVCRSGRPCRGLYDGSCRPKSQRSCPGRAEAFFRRGFFRLEQAAEAELFFRAWSAGHYTAPLAKPAKNGILSLCFLPRPG